eukprot:m.314817 g.314817  ORF g.314817 m.314817 type:complete len:136 (+) comp19670_c0_seq1:119-526(+)
MAASVEEFLEVLQHETRVDVARLQELASHGIRQEVRWQVWKYLLGVGLPDPEADAAQRKHHHTQYVAYSKDNSAVSKVHPKGPGKLALLPGPEPTTKGSTQLNAHMPCGFSRASNGFFKTTRNIAWQKSPWHAAL